MKVNQYVNAAKTSKGAIGMHYSKPSKRSFVPLDGLYHGTRIIMSQITAFFATLIWYFIFTLHSTNTSSFYTAVFMIIALGCREAALQYGYKFAYKPPLILMKVDNYDKIMSWGGILGIFLLQTVSSFFGFPPASSALGALSFWISFVWSDFLFLLIVSIRYRWSPFQLFKAVFSYSFTSGGMEKYEKKLEETADDVKAYVRELQRYNEENYDYSWQKKLSKWYRKKILYQQMIIVANKKGRHVFYFLARLPEMKISLSAIAHLVKIKEEEINEIINALDYLNVVQLIGKWDSREKEYESFGKDPSVMVLPSGMAFITTLMLSFSILEAIPNTEPVMYYIFGSLLSAIAAVWAGKLRLY